ncbi:MAG: complex I NDUFA9 subunit family protein [Gammaproteobacteria bacterium]|nr:complex I NDUFA9 subunit family protein [Gammaproteobacteria bacterium]
MKSLDIALLGGSGFVGTALANRLVAAGHRVRVLTRDREHARSAWMLPSARVLTVNAFDGDGLAQALVGCDAVVNLVGILNERRDDGRDFHHVHVELPERLIQACRASDVRHCVHLGALAASPDAPSRYLRSKGEAEQRLQAAVGRRFAVDVLRPSVIFGPHDDFLNRFARMLRAVPGPLPFVLPLAGAGGRLQPVYLGDVVSAGVRLLEAGGDGFARYDLGGPQVLTIEEVVRYVARLIERRVLIVPLAGPPAALLAWLLEFAPGKPMTRDNLRSLGVPSVCAGENHLLTLGIHPTPLDAVVPGWLAGRQQRARYDGMRRTARRAP